MKELDFTQKASLGQYLPGDSALHKLIPQIKLIAIILFLGGLLGTSPVFGTLLGLFLVITFGLISRIPLKFLFRNVKPMIPFLLIIALMQLFFTIAGDSPDIAHWGRFTITLAGLLNSIGIFLRFITLMGLLTLFTAVTPSREIGHGTEILTSPLNKIGFPAHAFSLVITIAFRFIPILTTEAENIMKAQASRGALLGTSRNPVKKIASYLPILVPLFVGALGRAEQLAEAMEARCFRQGEKRSRYIIYTFALRDGAALAISLLFSSLLIFLRIGNWENVLYQIIF